MITSSHVRERKSVKKIWYKTVKIDEMDTFGRLYEDKTYEIFKQPKD